MKKRLLSALLALALVFVLLPTTALAGVTTESDYDISIDGKRYKFDSDGSGGYTTAYYQENNSKTPTSNCEDVWQTNPYLEITRVDNIITITVKIGSKGSGKSVTIGASTQENYECIAVNGTVDLIITGDKGTSLTLNKTHSGAALSATNGSITITDGVKVSASFRNKADGNYVFYAIWAKNLTVSGANTEVTASGNCEDAIHVSGTVTVSKGAKLTATNDHNDKYKPYPITKSSAIKSDVLTIADENSCVIAQAIDSSYGKPLRIQNYNIAGATIKAGSSNYNSTETTIDKIDGNTYVKISIPALERDSDVLIAGEQAIVGQWTDIPAATGTGSYSYDADKKELTLKDVNITSGINAIQFMANGAYTIKLEGTNKISNVSNGISVTDDKYITSLNVTITGTGSLDISAKGLAINMKKGDLKFENTGEIKLTTSNISPTHNVLSVSGNITIADMEKYKVEGIVQDNTKDGGDTVTLSEASHLKGYQNPDGTAVCLKTITITPTPAKDSTISYGKKTLKQGEIIKGEISGTATVATKGNTITLNNFNGTAALSFEATLADSTLVLEGTNTLSSIVTTQKGLTISGSGSLTVGSIRVPNNTQHTANLTITGGAHVTVNRPSEDKPAVEVSGNLTVTGDGTQLSAECTAATNPAIEVGGNVTISGNPGTNAYTVKAYNKYDTPRDRDDKLRPSQMPSAFEISGNLSISGSAQVMAQTNSDGAAVWMPKEKVISVADASLIAQNSSHNFSTISFGDGSNMGNIYAKGQVNIVAENMLHSSSSLAHRAIKAFIYNHYSTGDSNPYYIKVVSEGVQSDKNVNVIPGHCTSTGGYKVTITRGDAYTTPQVAANYTIAGQTMHVGKYYKTDAKGNITDGTAQDYNIYCDSKNDFTLNNATISSTGTDVAINTNIRYETNVQHHIKLIGTNRINNTFKHAISAGSNSSTIIIEGVGNASDASLTINGNFLPIYSDGKVIINAEVVIVNTTDDNSFKGLISTSDGKGAFDLGSGYKCYASTSTTGTPLEEFNSANYGAYKYLRVTTQTPETGGGSTHEHVWDEAWHDTGDYHHAHQCTICKAYDTTTQESHNVTGHRDNHDGSHSNICGSCGYSAKVSHSYTWAPNANDNEKHIGTCVCGNVVERYHNFVGDVCSDCGYDKSTGTTCEHVWTTEWTIDTVDNEYHWHKCIKCNAITDKKPHAYTIVTDSGTNHIRECECKVFYVEDHISSDWIIDAPATPTTAGSMHKECTVCKHKMQTEVIPATGEIVPPTPDNPGTIVIIRPAEEEKPAQQPNPSTGANDLVGLAVAAAVAAALGSAALLRKHD